VHGTRASGAGPSIIRTAKCFVTTGLRPRGWRGGRYSRTRSRRRPASNLAGVRSEASSRRIRETWTSVQPFLHPRIMQGRVRPWFRVAIAWARTGGSAGCARQHMPWRTWAQSPPARDERRSRLAAEELAQSLRALEHPPASMAELSEPGRLFEAAWGELTEDRRGALRAADPLVTRIALETAAVVAETLRAEDVAGRPVSARKAEKDVLEIAAKELQLLVLHTAASAHALDGQIPMSIETGSGAIGIEVKSGTHTIATDEVDKFRADLCQSPFAVGVFVSLRAPIAKIPRGVHVQRELSLGGAVLAIFVSPVGTESAMVHLARGALSLACLFARQTRGRLESDDAAREAVLNAEDLGAAILGEVTALGCVRKRLREEEDGFQRRVDRASDALAGVQHRLSSTVSKLSSAVRARGVSEEPLSLVPPAASR